MSQSQRFYNFLQNPERFKGHKLGNVSNLLSLPKPKKKNMDEWIRNSHSQIKTSKFHIKRVQSVEENLIKKNPAKEGNSQRFAFLCASQLA